MNDSEAIAHIYNHYVLNSAVTFETQTVSDIDMTGRIEEVTSAGLPWLVSEYESTVTGFAYATVWNRRSAYRHSVECTVYLDPVRTGRGLGAALFDTLLGSLRDGPIHTLLAAIALPNPASVALHEKFGFAKVAHIKEVGFKFDKWIDVGYWQKML